MRLLLSASLIQGLMMRFLIVLSPFSLSSVDGGCGWFGVNRRPHGYGLCFTDQHEVQEKEKEEQTRR